jgi:hypothetical protein
MTDKYIVEDSNIWTLHKNYLYSPFPRTRIFNSELREIKERFLFARCSYDFDINIETDWWYIVKDGKEDISAYNSKHRNQIKRGLKNFKCIPVDISVIINSGYTIFNECMISYGTDNISKQMFRNSIESDELLKKHVQFFGIYDDRNKLVGYAKNLINDNLSFVFYENIYIPIKYKKLYSNYSLIHEMNDYYLNQSNYKYVSDGTRTLLHPTGIQDFLISKFHFRKAYCRMDIKYNGLLKLLIPVLDKSNKAINGAISKKNARIKALLEQHRVYKASKYLNE